MLREPVTNLKGIGDKMAEDLALMHIYSIEDLLNHFPYRYDIFEIRPLSELIHDDKVTIEGRVIHDPSLTFYGKKKSRLTFTLEVEQVAVKAVMFNRAFAKKQIHQGDTVTLTGKWDAHRLQITVSNYKKGHANQQAEIQPIYSVKGNITNVKLKKLIQQALKACSTEIEELLPNRYLASYKIPTRSEAFTMMHFPKHRVALKHARRRFIYEEFLLFQLKMQLLRKLKREATVGNAQHYNSDLVQAFIASLPFALTNAQEKSLNQILSDMKSPYRMSRLLQGDVGSGKTAVAAICLYASLTAGKQGALMVPTEILAEQHFQSLVELFDDKVNVTLLTGSVKGKKRKAITEGIEKHEINIVVGTHALIQEDVIFDDLGFVIVDEQHRFGVEQRRILREKGLQPDVLFMTATPIPRTLAITAFGDMDVSVIDEMPMGRKEIETYWVKENTLDRVLHFIHKQISLGEQAYIICPLIEESDKLDIQNAVDVYQQLQAFYPEEIKIGLMHGRLPTEEKDAVMKQFADNEVQILVSTTVVEVGVNVPNATVMVIYDAERFGLSQLHQLRGRVGRGAKQSYCILIADPKGETGKERMRIMSETTDGFALSEEDLRLRGPGDFFGRKQSGVPEFKVADMIHDYRALETARKDAQNIIDENLLEDDPEFRLLQQYVEENSVFNEKLD
ncbi:ATP-dependent DNA helicase RecG [Virgibacillus sp. AGTR]|uniref:ATP-dependent DNA helicase RecG n=1 Tax=Virgibacillus salarius TaxID=447199 RepID=A0A941DT44_9BACI|nr:MULTISPECIES: ATP-dependent DNA helicase RecG [Virgibacillus]NAZ07627.1 ATP-dependent DNA helicase RecG [Agaribacter marinus]MBR7794907.1 ATP-dependent DNA helicase RecG [Virgibacillus salarius]MCC2249320.1 ATP-dependent DNA helicase RecG [Virgibacillus sp. AGTR]MDY7043854.1 ATP-dependent DNA helicase RecG [Virgibacillus sp. M23]QRZ17353.1 ATP-dependent DNA helicase RecG [Virgibacillus sp. AGTR]